MAVNDLPSNVTYGTVVGRFLLAYADGVDSDVFPDGVPAKGTVLFTPSAKALKNLNASPAPVTILPGTIECSLDTDGYLLGSDGTRGVRLIATDNTENNPYDWTWRVDYRFTDQDDIAVATIPFFHMELPGGGQVDLTSASPVADSNGVLYLTGPPNILQVGTVTTSAPGSDAEVEIVGLTPNQVINFTLPQGIQGPAGNLTNLQAVEPVLYNSSTSTLSLSYSQTFMMMGA